MPKKHLIEETQDTGFEWQDGCGGQTLHTETGNEDQAREEPGIPEESARSNTETELAEFGGNSDGIPEDDSENARYPHTETESDSTTEDMLPQNDSDGTYDSEYRTISSVPEEYPSVLHTEMESDAGGPASGPADEDAGEEINSDSESGFETDEATADVGPGGPETLMEEADSHTGLENASDTAESPEPKAKTPRRRARKSQSGENAEQPVQTDVQPETAAPIRRRRARAEPVLAIDEERSVETQADKLRNDLLDLVESQKGRRILTGTIQGVERSADNHNITFAVIYHGAFKVIIPAEETVQPPEDFRDRPPSDVMHYLVTKRLGAEVDFIVKGVDVNSGIAAASRLEAMTIKRRQYYFGSDRDGNNLIYEGLSAEARVVSVIRAGIFVDLFGLETYMPLRELSYQRWLDAAAHFQPGQRVLVKILKLDRSSRDNIRVSASVKQAGDNPYEQALKRYSPGSRYVGTVSMVDTTGVFVSLDGGVDCLCSYPRRGRPPRGARVTVRIIGVNHENNRIWGAITHMTTAR